ncbi:MAG TPA: TetR/AcrR family transcriptional regulator [Streptosporangiaceae bacterium]
MPTSRPTRQDKRQANRARILQAARKVFGQRGYHGATIEQIAAEAGLSNGAVYYNFANKEDLFFALLDEWRRELVQDLASALPRPGSAEPGRSFEDELSHVIGTLKRRREWRLLLFEFVTYAARNPKFRDRFAAGRQTFKQALADALAERIAAHHLQPVAPPERLVVLVTALVNGLAVDEFTEPGGIPGDLLATALMALMDRGRQPGAASAT